MVHVSSLDLAVLIGVCAVFVLGMALAMLWLRRVIAQMEDATAALEILHEHPDLLQSGRWEPWTGGMSLPPMVSGRHPRLIGHA